MTFERADLQTAIAAIDHCSNLCNARRKKTNFLRTMVRLGRHHRSHSGGLALSISCVIALRILSLILSIIPSLQPHLPVCHPTPRARSCKAGSSRPSMTRSYTPRSATRSAICCAPCAPLSRTTAWSASSEVCGIWAMVECLTRGRTLSVKCQKRLAKRPGLKCGAEHCILCCVQAGSCYVSPCAHCLRAFPILPNPFPFRTVSTPPCVGQVGSRSGRATTRTRLHTNTRGPWRRTPRMVPVVAPPRCVGVKCQADGFL